MSTLVKDLAKFYDFVVVGGGTSGLTVASRLSEKSDIQVLVLEAGHDHLDDPRVLIPALCMQAPGSELDWQFMTVPQEQLKQRRVRQPQGQLLGGSSAINNQAFISPSSAGIDAWAKLGNAGWTWAEIEPYYRKFYTLNVPDEATSQHLGLDYITDTDREARGPVQVSYTGVAQDPLSKAWVETFQTLSMAWSETRSYSASAFYAPVMERKNLSVLTAAQVDKIHFEENERDRAATSVSFKCEGKTFTVGVRKEVILAAGTFQSPRLLELSGIGNSQILNSLGIPVMVDNENVGENLQDHLMTGISFEVQDGVMTGDSLMRQEPEAMAAATDLYRNHQAGPLTVGGIASHAFMPLPTSRPSFGTNSVLEDMLLKCSAHSKNEFQYDESCKRLREQDEASGALFMFLAQSNLHNNESVKDYLQNLQPGNFISLGACQTHVFSRGSSHIISKDVSDTPCIDPRYFSHPLDLEMFSRHVQFIEKLARSSPLSSHLKPNGKRNHPTAYVDDLEAAKDYCRTTALSCYHPAGTCAMLPRDEGGVVNNRLTVYGTRNLRVVDASIMPLIPRSNLQSTVYAVAERAADLIKADL
ncbi:hypothetical protein ACLMJK_001701 [Lecanora helva]